MTLSSRSLRRPKSAPLKSRSVDFSTLPPALRIPSAFDLHTSNKPLIASEREMQQSTGTPRTRVRRLSLMLSRALLACSCPPVLQMFCGPAPVSTRLLPAACTGPRLFFPFFLHTHLQLLVYTPHAACIGARALQKDTSSSSSHPSLHQQGLRPPPPPGPSALDTVSTTGAHMEEQQGRRSLPSWCQKPSASSLTAPTHHPARDRRCPRSPPRSHAGSSAC